MTFSIVARSADGSAHGIAVASKFLAVGAVVPGAEAGHGALATQAYANLAYRPQGLMLLRTSVSASDVVAGLTAADPGRAQRQLGVVGRAGDGAAFTGQGCHDWAGGVAGDGFAIQGNILTGPEVVEAMRDAWLSSPVDAPLARRLLAALRAGDTAGGDRRGRQSAALYVVEPGKGYGGTSDVVVDLRADDHPDPCAELARLLDIHSLLFDKADPDSLLPLEGAIAHEVHELLSARGVGPQGWGAGEMQSDLDSALAEWAGVENLEERLVPGKIDPVVLNHLRRTTT